MKRQPAGRCNGVTPRVDEAVTDGLAAVAADRDRLAGIARDRPDHVQSDIGVGRRRDAAFHRIDARHAGREPADHRRGQHRKAADAREHKDAAPARRIVEPCNAFDEIGAIGEVEIVDAERERRFHHPIGIVAVSLERTGDIHDRIGRNRFELALDIAIAVECRRHQRRRRLQARTKARLRARAPGDDQRQPRVVGQQLRQPAAEGAVAAENEDFERARIHAQRGRGHAARASSAICLST